MNKITSVEEYIERHTHFQQELQLLHNIITSTELEETIKWNSPVYTLNGKNVIGLGAFKNHFGIWFFNGVFLKDKHHVLVNAQEDKTKALRQLRFESKNDINKNLVLSYIKEAIENQKLGKELKPKRHAKELSMPMELKDLISNNTDFKAGFASLTTYKQREYCEYISTAKREMTKLSRLEKIIPMVLQGIGLNDKYR
ncbi:YdeI/OmpD-associated family protein [Aestuariibaculum lutulentum]|uniref:DUF1801 domain-containing protein n=1 Tax=Aestuariibaculum lutulentum TaxID=2920935 RepID=A0ABS9RE22_9FLAO|nr:DUF1801 domain-containing protein [Aestuariibaculum lutulentum]MCH4551193.1 DUF1801 domain-containing protein [Aestuariibaculum lutulentum]